VDLVRAIAMAGGLTKIANLGKVTVKRVVGGKEELLKLNARNMGKTAEEPAFIVRPDDQITIGESVF